MRSARAKDDSSLFVLAPERAFAANAVASGVRSFESEEVEIERFTG